MYVYMHACIYVCMCVYICTIVYTCGGKQWQTTPQELAQDAVCQNHTGHMTGLWFLPTRPLRLNANE